MRRTGVTFIVLASILRAASGCGTLLNLDGKSEMVITPLSLEARQKIERPPFPLGGLTNDVAWIKNANQPIDIMFSLVDMPFSLVGDLVTLPWTTYQWLSPSPNVDAEWRRFWLTESPPQADPATPK